jgi:hypothetical protein
MAADRRVVESVLVATPLIFILLSKFVLEPGEGNKYLLESCSCNLKMLDLSFVLQITHNFENPG